MSITADYKNGYKNGARDGAIALALGIMIVLVGATIYQIKRLTRHADER
jgi:hypothetical protein